MSRAAVPIRLDAEPAGATGAGGYRAPWWLPGGDAQTVYPSLLAPLPRVEFTRTIWTTPDGDPMVVDACGAAADAEAPTVVLLHGLEGSSRSHYARSLMHAVTARGWHGLVVHFRGCGGVPNRLPRAYHSGDSDEVDWILARLRAARSGPLCAVGVSLGGNVLLKWLGERGGEAARVIQRAAAVSVPFDLAAGADALERGAQRLYGLHFLRTMKPKALAMLAAHPGLFDPVRLAAARTLREFDDAFTAPVHGFADAADYYRRSSSKRFVAALRVPTLLVSARNDPFLPGECLPEGPALGPDAVPEYSDTGGHAGFCSGPPPGRCEWMPRRVLDFLHPGRG